MNAVSNEGIPDIQEDNLVEISDSLPATLENAEVVQISSDEEVEVEPDPISQLQPLPHFTIQKQQVPQLNPMVQHYKTPHPNDLNNSASDDDGSTCPICLDNWSNYGEHRLCSLKCGHLFGLKCIERWFAEKQNSCPTCKKKSVKNQVRNIYARKLVALDTSEYENIKRHLNEVREHNNRMQIEVTKGACREHLLLQQVENLKKDVETLNSKINVQERFSQVASEPFKIVRLYKDKMLEICSNAGCRVLDHYVKQDLVVASIKSPNALFPGFGVRKINISTYKPTTFLPLHTKSIRDLSIHPQNPWLLSVSLDKTLKIVDVTSNCSISGYTAGQVPLWACCWDLHNLNTFYIGSQQGSVSTFDLRNMSEPVTVFEIPADMSPVVSLAPLRIGGFIKPGSFILCKLNSLWVIDCISDERLPLPLEGPFTSMRYQNSTNHLLVSTRPNSQYAYMRHLISTVENGSQSNFLCNTIHTFPGSPTQKYLSRSCFVDGVSDSYVAAHQEYDKSVTLWSISTGKKACSIPAHDPVLDICSFSCSNNNFVVSLTEKRIEFFKFV